MSAVWWTAFVAALFLVNIAAHEAGHAVALRGLGGDISAGGLGMPWRPMLRLAPTERRRWTFTLSPWLLGAYVRPTEHTVEELIPSWRYRDRAWYAGAGVVINAVIGCGLLAVDEAIRGRWTAFGVALGLGLVLWFARRFVCAYVVPVVGIVAIAAVVWAIAITPPDQAQGILGTVELFHVSDGLAAVEMAALLSIALAVMNCLPFMPLDGGRIVDAALRSSFNDRVAEAYGGVTVFAVLVLFAYGMVTDVWSVLS